MGELKKEEGNKEEKQEGGQEEKKEEKKEEEAQEMVLKVDMHCEACARRVARALRGFQGVEDVMADSKASKVVVKGKTTDPIKVIERIQRKSGRKVEIISPLPKPLEEDNKEENKEPKDEKKEEPPVIVTVVLKVGMHCEACAQVLQRKIRKVKGVESVTTNLENDQVVVKGIIDPEKLVSDVYKKTRKKASIVKDEEKKEEEKKVEEKKENKKAEKEGEKKEGEEGKGEDNKIDIKKSEYWPAKYFVEYTYPPQIFSDENPHACSIM